jgi:hypothetical protein
MASRHAEPTTFQRNESPRIFEDFLIGLSVGIGANPRRVFDPTEAAHVIIHS